MARRSNNYTLDDYKTKDALLALLDHIVSQKHYGITFRRGGVGTEYVPACTRLGGRSEDCNKDRYSIGDFTDINELEENNILNWTHMLMMNNWK